jgi:hypothetical protein
MWLGDDASPISTWCCPTTPPVSMAARMTSPRKHRLAWEAAVCWDDAYAIKRLAQVRAV